MTEYALAYLMVGLVMVALALCSPDAREALPGWTRAILTCIAFVLFWPALVIFVLVKRLVGWRRHQ